MAAFALGFCVDVLAESKSTRAQISISGTGGVTSPIPRDELVLLVIDGPNVSFDGKAIPAGDVVNYVNKLLETKKSSVIGVYAREGARYGDVVSALDTLRDTTARNVSLSTTVLPYGKEP